MNQRFALPDPFFVRAILIRAAGLWLGVRMMTAFVGLPAGTLLLPTGVAVSLLIMAVTAALAAVELRRRNEFLLLGSMGHSPGLLLGISALPVLPLEALFTALVQ